MMSRTWIEPTSVDVPADFLAAVGGHRLIAETLMRRGINTVEAANAFLDPSQYVPASPFALPGMQAAVDRLKEALARHERICIWGDFDVDGQTATALLVTVIKRLGGDVYWHIPSRADGHGMKIERMRAVLAQNPTTRLIITCDTGIAEHDAIVDAQAGGVDVIVTDHHQLPAELPPAVACVNPQLLPAAHPLHTLPGVGCAYKFMEALTSDASMEGVLDLVALGIVADVAVQTGDTRYLLQRGLAQLRQGTRLGLSAIFSIAEIDAARVDEETIGFVIAPRLNALGRLGDANDAVRLLITEDAEQAQILAYRIEALNNERRSLTEQIYEGAQQQIQENPKLLDYAALVLSHPRWVAGVLGIVANRLVEAHGRPTVLLVAPEDGDGERLAHGSARSIAGCDITQAIATQSALLKGYGGHTMAAGVTLEVARIADFRRGLSRAVQAQLGIRADTALPLAIDSYVMLDALSLDLLADMARLSPFGAGNAPLTLAVRDVTLIDHHALGRGGEHCRLVISDASGRLQDVVWWRADMDLLPREGRFDLAFTLHRNLYKGKEELQLKLVDLRMIADHGITDFKRRSELEIVDYRAVDDAVERLSAVLKQYPDAVVWNEGEALKEAGVISLRRDALTRASTLVIWTIPPSPEVLREALTQTKPERVILFAQPPTQEFLPHLAGLIKYALSAYDGVVNLATFAGLTAQTEAIVIKGIETLVLENNLRIVNESGTEIIVAAVEEKPAGRVEKRRLLRDQLTAMLEETAAFRAYFKTANVKTLLGASST